MNNSKRKPSSDEEGTNSKKLLNGITRKRVIYE